MSIIERIRWSNVAKLVLAVAAGLLIAVGPHGCRSGEDAAPLPRALPPAPPTVRAPREPALRRPRPHRHRPHRSAPARSRAEAPPVSNEGPAPTAPRVPAPRTSAAPRAPAAPHSPPGGRAGEFF